ncbi:NAD(P)H-dependent flavin oxidoreductase [Bacteroidota bacterium]
MNELIIGDLKVKVPIIQGGMGVAISLSGLASAVANQGGIGVISAIGLGMKEPNYMKNFHKANKKVLRKEIRKAKSLTNGVLGVNIMLAVTDWEEMFKISIEEEIDIVFLGAGLPLKMPETIHPDTLKLTRTKIAPKVSSPRAVNIILKYWAEKYNHLPDAFVIEGPLAGGHLGFRKTELTNNNISLSSLIRETVEIIKPYEEKFNKEIPVIAAGGIYTGKDIFEIMQHGAKAVKMGTRFVTTHECDASIEFKESYINSSKEDITIIDSPVGLPGRAIRNNFIDEINSGMKKPFKCYWRCIKPCDYKNAPYCIAQALFNAANGKMDEGFSFAGTNAYKATKLESVKEIMDELIQEYKLSELAASYNQYKNISQAIAS